MGQKGHLFREIKKSKDKYRKEAKRDRSTSID